MIAKTYGVIGMTCEHCVSAVIREVGAIDGVSDVTATLVAGGVSNVTVVSSARVPTEALVAALDEAGDYTIAADPA